MSPVRDPEVTRKKILEVAAEQISANGFAGTSLAEILSGAQVSKGALYHHFSSKTAMAYAAFEEVMLPEFLESWSMPLGHENPILALAEWFEGCAKNATAEELRFGCPVTNLCQEISSEDEGFRQRFLIMFSTLENHLVSMLAQAKENGQTREDIDERAVAKFIVASFHGMSMQGRYAQDIDVFRASIGCMSMYLHSLVK